VIETIARHGEPNELALLLQAVGLSTDAEDAAPSASPAESRAIGEALLVFQRRGALHRDTLSAASSALGRDVVIALAGAVANSPDADGFALVRGLLESDGAVATPQLLAALQFSAPSVPRLARTRAFTQVRRRLESRDTAEVLAAIGAVRALGDVDAAPTLVTLLEGEPTRLAARAALTALTGRDHGERAGEWRGWLAQEDAWARAAPQLAPLLRAGPAAEALRALHEVLARHTHVSERRQLVSEALAHPAPSVRSAAAAGLLELADESALAALVRVGQIDRDADVREVAQRTIEALTR
jgi:hypothetical protein